MAFKKVQYQNDGKIQHDGKIFQFKIILLEG